MNGRRAWFGRFLGLALLSLLPTSAFAQSTFVGTVTDDSGGVLPGVTVEVASPVLIEGSRSAVTDGSGRYSVVQLRPGVYKMTFSLAGFGTAIREGVELPADFTSTIDIQLKVGALEESVTVSGQSPVVDVTSSAKTETISRALLDALPTPRNTQSFGYLAQGVRISKPDVGGQQQMEQVNMRVHGASELHTTMQIEGMLISPAFNDGAIQNYMNQAHFQETTFTTSSQLAEVSAGGVRLNMIPRDGGNQFSGAMYFGTTETGWQKNNLTDSLQAKGLKKVQGVNHIRDYNPAFGGPISQNKLWFFGSVRYTSVDETVIDAYLSDGVTPAVVDQYVDTALLRMTAQVTPKNKVSAFLDRAFKYKGHEFTFGIEPERASRRRNHSEANYHTAGAKWTSTVSNRVLLEVGFTQIVERLHSGYQPTLPNGTVVFPTTKGVDRPDNIFLTGAPPAGDAGRWFRDVSRLDLITNQRTIATSQYSGTLPDRYVPMAAISYVTGTHNVKAGWQWAHGQDRNDLLSLGDIETAQFRNGVAESVIVSGGPWGTEEQVRADTGVYVQDTWKVDKLTLNLGLRYEHFNSGWDEQFQPGGRFVPARTVAEVSDLPKWDNWVPRLGFAYDISGDGQTAVKGGFNKYLRPYAGSFAKRFNPLRGGGNNTDLRDWFDCALTPGTVTCDPTKVGTVGYKDNVVQDNEVGPSNNKLFGIGAPRRAATDADAALGGAIVRDYNLEQTLSLQHRLTDRIGVTAGWFRRQYYNLHAQANVALTANDWTAFTVANPIYNTVTKGSNGHVVDIPQEGVSPTVTIYNLNVAKRGLQDIVDYNSDVNTHISNDFEVSFTSRLGNGGTVFGGWTAMRNEENNCDQWNPNGSSSNDLYSSISFTQGGQYCDQTNMTVNGQAVSMPYRHDFKLAANYPLMAGFEVSGTWVSFAGNMTQTVWNVPASSFPGAQRTQSTIVQLNAPGTEYLERWNQVDISGKRNFKLGRYTLTAQADVYNLLNGAMVQTRNTTLGSNLDNPQTILNGRLLRLVAQMKW